MKITKKQILIIVFHLLMLISVIIYFNKKSNYISELEKIENDYKLKNDSLYEKIDVYMTKINNLDSINKNISIEIDSIKNKQNDNEKIPYTPFHGLSADSVANLFAKYKIEKRYIK